MRATRWGLFLDKEPLPGIILTSFVVIPPAPLTEFAVLEARVGWGQVHWYDCEELPRQLEGEEDS